VGRISVKVHVDTVGYLPTVVNSTVPSWGNPMAGMCADPVENDNMSDSATAQLISMESYHSHSQLWRVNPSVHTLTVI
jgi:hypothetical protein